MEKKNITWMIGIILLLLLLSLLGGIIQLFAPSTSDSHQQNLSSPFVFEQFSSDKTFLEISLPGYAEFSNETGGETNRWWLSVYGKFDSDAQKTQRINIKIDASVNYTDLNNSSDIYFGPIPTYENAVDQLMKIDEYYRNSMASNLITTFDYKQMDTTFPNISNQVTHLVELDIQQPIPDFAKLKAHVDFPVDLNDQVVEDYYYPQCGDDSCMAIRTLRIHLDVSFMTRSLSGWHTVSQYVITLDDGHSQEFADMNALYLDPITT